MVGIKDFDMPSCCNSCGHWSFNRDDEPLCDLTYEYIRHFDKRQDDCPLIEAIPKADYENRLKADLAAMLTDLSMKIGEIEDGYVEFDEENKRSLTMIPLESVERLIDEEINSLEEA